MAVREMIRSVCVAAALCAPAQAVLALTPPAPCAYVSELGRFLGPNEADLRAQRVLPGTFENNIVFFEVTDLRGRRDGSHWAVVQHCPTSLTLLVDMGQNMSTQRATFVDMVFGTAAYTMEQMAAEMQRLGARTELEKVNLGDCPCDHRQFYFGR